MRKSVRAEYLVFGLTFVFLFFFRFKALFYPPYWDGIMGPVQEGIWLLENKFNFIKLALEEYYWTEGGPRTYLISFYPSFLALLMILIKSSRTFNVVNHLITYALSAGIITGLYSTLRRSFHYPYALIVSLLVFFHPMFLSHSYAINMEIPGMFFSLFAVMSFLKERFYPAGIFALLAFFTKALGLIAPLSFMALYTLLYFRFKDNLLRHIKILLFYSLSPVIFVIYAFLSSRYFAGETTPHHLTQTGIGLYKTVLYSVKWPDLFFLIALVPLSAVILLFKYRKNLAAFRSKRITEAFTDIRDELKREKVFLVSLVLCAVLMASFASTKVVIPRYFLVVFPFFFLLLLQGVLRKAKKIVIIGIAVVIGVFYAANMRGRVYDFYRTSLFKIFKMKQMEVISNYKYFNDGHILETTLGYEDDMELNRELTAFVEQNFPDKKIIANWPISFMLWHPKFGYVSNPDLYVVDLQKSSIFARENFATAEFSDWTDYIWISVKNSFSYDSFARYDPEKDILLKRLKKGNLEAVIFQRRF